MHAAIAAGIGRQLEHVNMCVLSEATIQPSSAETIVAHIQADCRRQFEAARGVLCQSDWQYFQFIDSGLARIRSLFTPLDGQQRAQPASEEQVLPILEDYARVLDDEIGRTLENVTDDTAVLIVSPSDMRLSAGVFAINEWLVREGLLTLREYPTCPKKLEAGDVDWGKTSVWAEGGPWARLYLNVKDREPQGVVERSHYEVVLEELQARLVDAARQAGGLSIVIASPHDLYETVTGVPPDLLVGIGESAWRFSGSIGHPNVHPIGACRHERTYSADGCFVLTTSAGTLSGEVAGVGLLDLAPTLLALGDHEIPVWMQGRSIIADNAALDSALTMDEAEVLRQRLVGLGYIE
jgi:predicted AlkP superfamily phosphohydrolase/phosphomutase